ncbi:MAG: DUF835 domain-containing protein [Thermoplasmata archaeon]
MKASLPALSKDDKEREFLRHLAFRNGFRLEEGRSYLVKEPKPLHGVEAFTILLSRGFQGLYITRQHPQHVRRRAEIRDCRVIWLSSTLGKDYVDPHNLSSLINLLRVFIETSDRSVVFIDGLEYLVTNNDFSRVLHFLECVNEVVMESLGILILSVDDRAFQKRELALLEKNTLPLP